jgi:hypothetical protein
MSGSHAGDEKRSGHSDSERACPQVDRVEIEIGQRIVLETDAIQTVARSRATLGQQGYANVVRFAIDEFRICHD